MESIEISEAPDWQALPENERVVYRFYRMTATALCRTMA